MKIRPMTGSPSAADVAADLRALADLCEGDGDGFTAAVLSNLINGSAIAFPSHSAGHEHEGHEREVLIEMVDRIAPTATEPLEVSTMTVGAGRPESFEMSDVLVPLRALKLRLCEKTDRLRRPLELDDFAVEAGA